MSGAIPTELGDLTNLVTLNLGGNQLSGEIPAELDNLIRLERLNLFGNQLSGCVPVSLRDQLNMDLYHLGGLPFCPASTATPYPTAPPSEATATPATRPTVTPTPAPSPISKTERAALMALYDATDGQNWNHQWNINAPVGEWYGVTTDSNGSVIELDLWSTGLSWEIPPELGNLDNLESLYISTTWKACTFKAK